MPNVSIPTFHGLQIENKTSTVPNRAGYQHRNPPSFQRVPWGHLCMEEAKCPPASRTGGPSADPTEGDIPEKIPG